jgi:hypothetical protein
MVAVYSVLSLLVVFTLSALIVRIGAIAFRMTGMSSDVASFQAASAYSGAGFTTDEAEVITQSPGRRRIARWLIHVGSLGVISGIASLTLSFTGGGSQHLSTLVLIIGGTGVIYLFVRSRWFEQVTTPIIERTLARTTDLRIRDYTQVLGLQDGYRVAEIDVDEEDWLTAGSIAELDLPAEGVLPLAVERADGTYIGAPGPDVEKEPGDALVLFGQEDRLQELSDRKAGDTRAREDAVEDHRETLEARDRSV